jgi:NNP family nitrate/nitrite transporter-like MFS transporter
LYTGSFGSFIGFSFALSQVLALKFTESGQSHAQAALHATQRAFLGPLLGLIAQVYDGRVAERIGGGRVTLAGFGGMIVAAGLLVVGSTVDDHHDGRLTLMSIGVYVVGLIAMFILAGGANGSIYKMIPAVFETRSHSPGYDEAQRKRWSQGISGALVGFADAVGGLGGVAINLALRHSYLTTDSETLALWVFLGCYAVLALTTWAIYVRRPVEDRP